MRNLVVCSLMYNLTFLVAIFSLLSFVGTMNVFTASSDRVILCTLVLCGLLTLFTVLAAYVLLEIVLIKPTHHPHDVGGTGVQPRIVALAPAQR